MNTATFDFTDSIVLVTGAGSGIGRGIAGAFLDAGATVVVAGRRAEPLAETIAGHPTARTAVITTDVSDSAQVGALVDEMLERFGRIDVVINNAAAYASGPITELDDDEWAKLRATNIDGFFHLAKATLPRLAESGGTFIAVSSVSGDRGDWGQAAYNASKAAITNFVRSLALDWGERGVRVNAVAPSFTITELTAGLEDNAELMARFNDRIALGRPAKPVDIAPAVLFLASDAAGYITGSVLTVDGGTSASTGQPHG